MSKHKAAVIGPALGLLALGLGMATASACVSPPIGQIDEQVRIQSEAENACLTAAISSAFAKVQNPKSPRPRWKVEFEIQPSRNDLPNILVDIESIGPDLGGGAVFAYDCNSKSLVLIEGFR